MLHSAVLLLLPDLTRLFNIHIRRLVPLAQIELEVALIKPEPVPEPKPEPKPGATRNQPPRLLDKHIAAVGSRSDRAYKLRFTYPGNRSGSSAAEVAGETRPAVTGPVERPASGRGSG